MADLIRIVLADDHAILRAGLEALLDLEPDFEVVGGAATGEEALERVRALRPDVVVMDLDMPGMDGLEATRRIVALETGSRVLVLTSQAEAEFLLPVLRAGGSGFVHKSHADEELCAAIRMVARDEVFLYPTGTKLLLDGYRHAEERGEVSPLEELTEREREVLALAAEGYSSTEIGKRIFLSPKTVDTYRSRMMQKLGLKHRAELVRFALQTGVLRPD